MTTKCNESNQSTFYASLRWWFSGSAICIVPRWSAQRHWIAYSKHSNHDSQVCDNWCNYLSQCVSIDESNFGNDKAKHATRWTLLRARRHYCQFCFTRCHRLSTSVEKVADSSNFGPNGLWKRRISRVLNAFRVQMRTTFFDLINLPVNHSKWQMKCICCRLFVSRVNWSKKSLMPYVIKFWINEISELTESHAESFLWLKVWN